MFQRGGMILFQEIPEMKIISMYSLSKAFCNVFLFILNNIKMYNYFINLAFITPIIDQLLVILKIKTGDS
jgi:hypothetical protein